MFHKMNNIFNNIILALKDRTILKRIFFIGVGLIIFRFLAVIPVPGVETDRLKALFENNQFLGLINIFSAGGLDSFSIIMLGVGPYITASIIMQLMTVVFPKLKAMYHEEGELGRRKFMQYSRVLTVPLAALQALSYIILLERQGIIGALSPFEIAINVILVTAGSVLLMWIGELMTEFGIGSGVSLIIFAGIVARIPTTIQQFVLSFDPAQIPMYLLFAVLGLAIVYGVVMVTEAERPIPVTYAKRVRGNRVFGGVSTYLPLRINQAGVMPIIFALSLVLFPQMILNFFNTTMGAGFLKDAIELVLGILSNGWIYAILYFVMVFLFTYFYTAVTFDPHSISENLQKNGAFIPGVRPGVNTTEYLGNVVTRITLVGALFLGFVAVLPLAMQAITGMAALAIGGTALLIAVSVVIDLMKKINAQVSMREY